MHQQLDIHYFKAAADVDEDEAIDDIALNCSNRERNAEECERDLVQLKTLEYLAKFKGKEFEAVITGIKDFGIIVELNRFLVDGLIHVRNIGEEFFVAAGNGTRMSGERGTVFKPGQPVKVVIVDVDLPRRRLEMRLRGFNDSDEAHGLYNVEGAQRTRSRKKRKGSKASGRMKSRSAGKSRRASSKAGSKNNRRKRRK
ncbi:MAG: S1 RNA-binding domain-containing protein [Planctomycetota bacterium]|nr:S1 RNA-binding domain-containing protein [Planctomycetota bacterium]